MDLTTMRTNVRRELHDEDSASYRWNNNELDRHIARAVKELSEHIPRQQKATLATAAGSREIAISSLTDRVMVEAVEYPVDRFPRKYQPFSLWADQLTVLGEELPDGSNAYIYYGKIHTLDAGTSTIPPQYEDLVAVGACGYAAVEWAVFAINRVNVGGGGTPGQFLDWGSQKLKAFRQELRRLGRRHRLRVSTLYRPHRPIASRSTDFGP
ncbi:MAG: hypothetical protein HYX91_04835 [Chloroflexi bacterium]|nr:hypothetical protein [Chloroflexota bacterium]